MPRPRRLPALVPAAAAVLAAVSVLAAAAPAAAQEAPRPRSGPGGASSPEAAVRGLFDAMRAGDSAAARALLHPDARLHRPVRGEDGPALRVSGVAGWLEAIGGAGSGELDEKIWDLEVRTDGDLASAWMRYALYVDGELHHCGVNAFQLVRLGDGWRAFAIADTRREEGCRGPPDRAAGR